MKHGIPLSILSGATIAACFGAGPTPTGPSAATIVFGVDPSASTTSSCESHYIGDVAFDAEHGYAIVLPYGPTNCGGGGSIPSEPLPVFQFTKAGGAAINIGSAGMSGTNMASLAPPRIVATASGPLWAFATSSTTNVTVEPLGLVVTPVSGAGVFGPQDFIAAGSGAYLASAATTSQYNDANNPDYLCCTNNSNSGQPGDGQITQLVVDGNGSGSTVQSISTGVLDCASSNHCFATTPEAVFWLGADGTTGQVSTIARTGGAITRFSDLVPLASVSAPVGISASASAVAWAVSVDHLRATSDQKGCAITVADPLSADSARTILSTTAFSCMDVAIDATSVYFAIVTFEPSGNDSGGSLSMSVRGNGIGRVPIAGGDLESLDLGFTGSETGPRRIYLDDTDIYAIDPQVIGKIAKTALDGRHDFAP